VKGTNKYLINIMGPTGVGKTDWSIRLAKQYEAEIFSSDSRQIFKEMDIGTAKPDEDTLNMVKHHFINHKSIQDNYSAGHYEKEIIPALDRYFTNRNIGILVGGTGLYIDAVLFGLDVFPEISEESKEHIAYLYKEKGLETLLALLKEKDNEYYETVDKQNSRRVVRAMEVIVESGKSYTSFLNKPRKNRAFQIINLIIKRPRLELYERINQRVDQMMEDGLLEEAEKLFRFKKYRSLQTVGYSELFKYKEGEYDLEMAVKEIKKNSRRYAKRQNTWLKRYDAEIFHPNDVAEIENYISSFIK